MKNWRSTALLPVFLLLLAACSSVPQKSNDDTLNPEELVSLDLVNVIYQVRNLNPSSTVLLMPSESVEKDDFAQSLMLTLQQAGYAIRTQDGGNQSKSVSYAISEQKDPNDGPVVTYTVHVGDVSVRRSYRQESDGWLRPADAMQIRGADASSLSVNDDIFSRSTGSEAKSIDASDQPEPSAPGFDDPAVQPINPPAADPVTTPSEPQTIASLQNPSVDSTATQVAALEVGAGASSDQVQSTVRQPLLDIAAPDLASVGTDVPFGQISKLSTSSTANVRDLGQSNFTDILQELGTVEETILTFGNDSTRMGPNNKQRVKQFVELFDPERDVFSVIGCSHGNTNVEGGQEALARGRALRVKEELQFAGIPHDKILHEGCWAGEQFDKRMPRRGVVLTIKRHE